MMVMLEIPDNTVIMTVQCLHFEDGRYTVTQAALDQNDIKDASVKKNRGVTDEA